MRRLPTLFAAAISIGVLTFACDPIASATKSCQDRENWPLQGNPSTQAEVDAVCGACCAKVSHAKLTGIGDLATKACTCKEF
jgi:hypothetical protein